MFSNFIFESIINIYLIVAKCSVVEANGSIITIENLLLFIVIFWA